MYGIFSLAQHPEYATTTTDEKAEKTVVPPLPQSPPPADSSSSGPSRERRASTPLREVLKAFVKAATTPKKRRVAVEEDDSDDVEYLREDGPSPKKAIKFAARRNARAAKGKGRANQVEEAEDEFGEGADFVLPLTKPRHWKEEAWRRANVSKAKPSRG